MRTLYSRLLIGVIVMFTVTLLSYTYFLRPWHMHWGATLEERTMSLPGDAYIPPGTVVSTRALTIHAPAAAVWPWIVQLGQGRGGFYSYVWLENLFTADMHNADHIVPALQHLQVGDPIALARDGPITLHVAVVEPARALVAEGGWSWYLRPIDEQNTRLIVRYASFPLNDTVGRLYYYPIFEPAHFVMESGMMLGLKARAEGRQ